MRPKLKIPKEISPSPDRRYPVKILYRPKVTKVEVTFNTEQFKVTNLIPQCKAIQEFKYQISLLNELPSLSQPGRKL